MANVNTSAVPYALTEEGLKILEELRNLPIPEIVKKCKTTANLAQVTAEDMPQFLPQLLKNDFALAEKIANTGNAVVVCASEIGKVNRKIGCLFLACGALALGGGYLYLKFENQQKEINNLRKRIIVLESCQQRKEERQ